jgi:hypothetical protein
MNCKMGQRVYALRGKTHIDVLEISKAVRKKLSESIQGYIGPEYNRLRTIRYTDGKKEHVGFVAYKKHKAGSELLIINFGEVLEICPLYKSLEEAEKAATESIEDEFNRNFKAIMRQRDAYYRGLEKTLKRCKRTKKAGS